MIRIGCQTYTWQMCGGIYDGRLDHIIEVVGRSKFLGVEPETRFLGKLLDPVLLERALAESAVQLPALTLVEDWRAPNETANERARADHCFEILSRFPGTLLNLCQMPGADRENLKERQANLLGCVNDIARRASDRGISVGYHPNSPAGSVFRTEEDYRILLDGLDENAIGFIPDTGHIAKAGMDPLAIIREYYSRVKHVHFKDMFADGRWALMGTGDIDEKAIVHFLAEQNYQGWIMVEDESQEAARDPDQVTLTNGEYVERELLPILK